MEDGKSVENTEAVREYLKSKGLKPYDSRVTHRYAGFKMDAHERYTDMYRASGYSFDISAKDFLAEVNGFTKDMLVSGEHWVRTRGYGILLYVNNGFIGNDKAVHINNYEKNLMYIEGEVLEQDVLEVYEQRNSGSVWTFSKMADIERLKSIWTRQEKTPQQLEYESLKEKMEEHNKLGEEMQEQLRKLGATL